MARLRKIQKGQLLWALIFIAIAYFTATEAWYIITSLNWVAFVITGGLATIGILLVLSALPKRKKNKKADANLTPTR